MPPLPVKIDRGHDPGAAQGRERNDRYRYGRQQIQDQGPVFDEALLFECQPGVGGNYMVIAENPQICGQYRQEQVVVVGHQEAGRDRDQRNADHEESVELRVAQQPHFPDSLHCIARRSLALRLPDYVKNRVSAMRAA